MKHEWMWHLLIGLIMFFGWGGCFLLFYFVLQWKFKKGGNKNKIGRGTAHFLNKFRLR